MNATEFSPKSVEDLEEILDFIAGDNPCRAINLVATLREQCEALTAFPGLGARRDNLAQGLRVFPVGNFGIYYHTTETGVRIERILHAARDVDALF